MKTLYGAVLAILLTGCGGGSDDAVVDSTVRSATIPPVTESVNAATIKPITENTFGSAKFGAAKFSK